MKNGYKYSVCCAVYNCEKYVEEAICSFLYQTYTNIELILVDDCSTDNSYNICKRYNDLYSNIILLKNECNCGPLVTKCKAINNASGDYILFLDADDYLEHNAIEIINDNMNSNIDLIMFGCKKVDNNKKVIEEYKYEVGEYNDKNRNEFLMLVATNSIYNSICTKCVKNEIYKKIMDSCEGISINRGDDKYISSLLYKLTKNILILDNFLYNYRKNDQGITVKSDGNYYIEYLDKENMKNLIYNDFSISENEIQKYDKYQVKQFKSQLIKISTTKIEYSKIIKLFNDIKKESYYNNTIKRLLKDCKLPIEISLFTNNMYLLLIYMCKFKKFLYNLFK